MRVPVSWLREYVDLPLDVAAADIAARLTMAGLKLEALHSPGADLAGRLVVGRVLSYDTETHNNGKSIRWCHVDVGPDGGEEGPRGIVCGAANFAAGDLVVVALPGAVLTSGFAITARKTYGHISDGMICSARELGIGDDHSGIIVLGPDEGKPGDDAAELLYLRDDVIELEINPDRAYALSLRGVAREVAIAYDVPFRDPAASILQSVAHTPHFAGRNEAEGYPVQVDDADACPVFVARTVTGFDASAATPRWLARRVQLAGMRPVSLAVDVTNYVMLELGQPIHGYDQASLAGPIVVRRAQPGERLTTLDGTNRKLHPEDLLITDDSGAIGLAGVMGGEITEIGAETTDILVEAAHFASVPVARTARRHKLPSEASKRFERGVDPQLPVAAAQRVAALLVEHGGGRIEPGQTQVGQSVDPVPITMRKDLPAEITAVPIDAATTVDCLRKIGAEVESGDHAEVTVVPPTWRPDLSRPHDLVEEVARLVGYDQVPSVLPAAPAGRGLNRDQRLRRRVGYALAGAGFVEVLSSPFTGPADWAALGLPADDFRRHTVRVANPLSEEEPELRTTLLPGVLRAAARNVGRALADVALFETSPVFLPSGTGTRAPLLGVDHRPSDEELAAMEAALPAQPRHLAIVLTGQREPAGWWGPARPSCWADALAAVRLVADVLDVPVTVRGGSRPPWHPGRCADVVLSDPAGTPVLVGQAGELHPRVCAAYGVPTRAAAAEVDLDALIAAAPLVVAAPFLSTLPQAKEDVAVVVAADVPAAEVEAALRAGAGPLLESVRLFDVYTGDQIEPGHKSLAFALRFRAHDRTLTEAETAAARDAAVTEAAARTGAVQRT